MKPLDRHQTVEELRYDLQMWLDPFSLVQQDKTLNSV